ncbi:MAG: hypothetical protein Q9185_005025 [Variospora sp. 1 TL-2023]
MGPPRSSKHLRPERTSSAPKPKPQQPSSTKKTPGPPPSHHHPDNNNRQLLLPFQQTLLEIFTTAFSTRFNATLKADIQSLKTHLYARDFARAFQHQQALEAYVVRWSAGRALAYLDLFGDDASGLRDGLLLLCGSEGIKMDVLAVDIAPWSSPLRALHEALTTGPPLSAYAGAAVKAGNRPLVPADAFSVEFRQRDVLEVEGEVLGEWCEGVGVVMLMFTLNELYSVSMAKTTRLLLGLTSHVVKGSMLCVVDSPGSYSTVGLGNGAADGEVEGGKKYPMQWLLDHTLLESAREGRGHGEGGERKWEKVHEQASRWFRLGEGLRYPIGLEDMRMQVHVYRRI